MCVMKFLKECMSCLRLKFRVERTAQESSELEKTSFVVKSSNSLHQTIECTRTAAMSGYCYVPLGKKGDRSFHQTHVAPMDQKRRSCIKDSYHTVIPVAIVICRKIRCTTPIEMLNLLLLSESRHRYLRHATSTATETVITWDPSTATFFLADRDDIHCYQRDEVRGGVITVGDDV